MNITEDSSLIEAFKYRLCPDYEGGMYRVLNGINNLNERTSLHYEIHKCKDTKKLKCGDYKQMGTLFNQLEFKMYTLTESADITSRSNIGNKPTLIQDRYFADFELDLNHYIEHKNEIVFNNI